MYLPWRVSAERAPGRDGRNPDCVYLGRVSCYSVVPRFSSSRMDVVITREQMNEPEILSQTWSRRPEGVAATCAALYLMSIVAPGLPLNFMTIVMVAEYTVDECNMDKPN